MHSLEGAGAEPQVKRTRQRAGAKTVQATGLRTDMIASPSPALQSDLGSVRMRSSAIARDTAESRPDVGIWNRSGGDRVARACDVARRLLSWRLQTVERTRV
jgi:hypothetical protein